MNSNVQKIGETTVWRVRQLLSSTGSMFGRVAGSLRDGRVDSKLSAGARMFVALAVVALTATPVLAVHDLGLLCLDGNADDTGCTGPVGTTPVDWNSINPVVNSGLLPPLPPEPPPLPPAAQKSGALAGAEVTSLKTLTLRSDEPARAGLRPKMTTAETRTGRPRSDMTLSALVCEQTCERHRQIRVAGACSQSWYR